MWYSFFYRFCIIKRVCWQGLQIWPLCGKISGYTLAPSPLFIHPNCVIITGSNIIITVSYPRYRLHSEVVNHQVCERLYSKSDILYRPVIRIRSYRRLIELIDIRIRQTAGSEQKGRHCLDKFQTRSEGLIIGREESLVSKCADQWGITIEWSILGRFMLKLRYTILLFHEAVKYQLYIGIL